MFGDLCFPEASMASQPSPAKICFNSYCKDVLHPKSSRGWRRRTGDYADLCDRCASAFAEGKFCETFHMKATGWRCCESCGKKIHCGCIVSFHMFVLLDAGGIECLNCTRNSFMLTPNPAWPPPSISLPVLPEKSKDLPSRSWSHRAGSGLIPCQQPSSMFSSSSAQSDLQPRNPFDAQRLGRIFSNERQSAYSVDKKKPVDSSLTLTNSSFKTSTPGTHKNGNSGITLDAELTICIDTPNNLSLPRNDAASPHTDLSLSSVLMCQPINQTEVVANQPKPAPLPTGKHFCGLNNGSDLCCQTKSTNGRPGGGPRQRNHLLSRYSPRITHQELQKISADSKSVITPLFEKALSISDAGKIGRLVIPKRCAEAYLPSICSSEGLPLEVQDSNGREWLFQFRFWPNNNSRMYVLEGVTPCIQSMHLQAGDVVTFSRIEPEGKLLMGYRKAPSASPSDQDGEPVNTGCEVPASRDKPENGEVDQFKVTSSSSSGFALINQAKSTDQAALSKSDEPGYISKEVLGTTFNVPSKRRNGTLGSRSKRVRIETKDQLQLTLACEQAQALLRPPRKSVPSIVAVEDIEVEEYEDAPVIGQPTYFATDNAGKSIQWIPCEDCHKWRKVPADALLPSKWTCSENSWDPQRSACSVAQEPAAEQLRDLLPTNAWVGSKKTKPAELDPDSPDIFDGLAGLANLAIQEQYETLAAAAASSQAATTTKHPRHKPGCTCIVCIQPRSGMGPRHKSGCTCAVCSTVRRRFRTMMVNRGKKDAKKAQIAALQHQKKLADDDVGSPNLTCSEDLDNDLSRMGSPSPSTLNGQIDLNARPEKDQEVSAGLHSGSAMMRLLQDASMKLLTSNNFNDDLSRTELALENGLPDRAEEAEQLSQEVVD